MGVSFVILFPLGGIIIRFLAAYLPVPTRLHYTTQLFTLLCVLAAMGLGIYLSKGIQFFCFRTKIPLSMLITDQIFGITIIGLLVLQASLGYYHHRRFLKDRPSSRRWFTHAHLWLGRFIILFGLANCGFGLRLALVDWKYVIIWWAGCAGLAVGYAGASLIMLRHQTKRIGEPFGNANGPTYSPELYRQAERYGITSSRGTSPGRI